MRPIGKLVVKRALAGLCGTCLGGAALGLVPGAVAADPEASFGGQYRINSYSLDSDNANDNQTANRLRIRQNIDLDFGDGLTTHLQLEAGHVTGNIGTTNGADAPGDSSGSVDARHAVIQYKGSMGVVKAGLVPIGDKFGDTLHSAAWDWNPLAAAGVMEAGPGTLRVGGGTVKEDDESDPDDDVGQYLADYEMPLAGDGSLVIGATQLYAPGPNNDSNSHYNYGVNLTYPVGGVTLNAMVLGSSTDAELLTNSTDDGSGVAAKLELAGDLGPGSFGLMGTYAGGEDDGSGFMPAMGVVGHQGYWGYTGQLTVQGPTDTGIDGDSVNIGNSGYGLTTVQAKYSFGITESLDGYLGAGWFGGSELNSGDVGTDLLAMGTYHFTDVLAWDFGVSYAQLEDGGIGYWDNGLTAGVSETNKGFDDTRTAVFSRFQAQF